MFHYTTTNLNGTRQRHSHDIAVGDKVQSRYRAGWRGVVLELNPKGGSATVLQEIDSHGNPFRKPKTVTYNCRWFKLIQRE